MLVGGGNAKHPHPHTFQSFLGHRTTSPSAVRVISSVAVTRSTFSCPRRPHQPGGGALADGAGGTWVGDDAKALWPFVGDNAVLESSLLPPLSSPVWGEGNG